MSNREALAFVFTCLGGGCAFMALGELVVSNGFGWSWLVVAGAFLFLGRLLKR